MERISSIAALRQALGAARGQDASVGLVPTMGFLHRGHMALADRARAENGTVVLSIFVNPTQFGPNEDFSTYPRDLERDLALCAAHGVDIAFTPEVEEMYPESIDTGVKVRSLSDILIGAQRPGHFEGVATVVTKLLNIVQPTRAYFGEKDFQQLAVVRRMVRDLSMPVEVVGVPTVREADGLACSSRNVRLTPADRAAAAVVPRALEVAAAAAAAGERDVAALTSAMRVLIEAEPRADLASLDIRDARSLGPLDRLGDAPAVILATVRFGNVLLIDQKEIGR